MMIDFLGQFGDAAHKRYAGQESVKLESAANGFRAFRPVRNGLQVKVDFFGGQGRHNNNKSIPVPPGAALFAAAGEFVDGGPGMSFRIFHADAFFLVAGLDVGRLTFCLSV
jgi:hypothetical protein